MLFRIVGPGDLVYDLGRGDGHLMTAAVEQLRTNGPGLSPGSVALYQINIQVPPGLAPGLYEITVTIGGVTSKAAQIYIG